MFYNEYGELLFIKNMDCKVLAIKNITINQF
ncbi:MAG: hypothetical protein H6Q18_527 [Bacteroidetes bacterium]|nr:hypothetical protein [Bacteroidota bacterium]